MYNKSKNIKNRLIKLAIILIYASFICILSGCGSKTQKNSYIKQVDDEFTSYCKNLFYDINSNNRFDLYSNINNPKELNIEIPTKVFPDIIKNKDEEKNKYNDILNHLSSIKADNLSNDNKILYNSLIKYINIEISLLNYDSFYNPLNNDDDLIKSFYLLMLSYNIHNEEDIEVYMSLLNEYDDFLNDIYIYLNDKALNNQYLTSTLLQAKISEIYKYKVGPDGGAILLNLKEQLQNCTFINDEQKNNYIKEANELLLYSYNTGIDKFIDELNELSSKTDNNKALYSFDNGQNYYKLSVNKNCGLYFKNLEDLSYTIDEQINNYLNKYSNINIESESDILNNIHNYDDCIKYLTSGSTVLFPVLANYNIESALSSEFIKFKTCDFINLENQDNDIKFTDRYNEQINNIFIKSNYLSPEVSDFANIKNLAASLLPGKLYYINYYKRSIIDRYGQENPIWRLIYSKNYIEAYGNYIKVYSHYFDESLEQSKFISKDIILMCIYAYLDLEVNYKGNNEIFVKNYILKYYPDIDETAVNMIYEEIINNPAKYFSTYAAYINIMKLKNKIYEKDKENDNPEMKFHELLLSYPPTYCDIINKQYKEDISNK